MRDTQLPKQPTTFKWSGKKREIARLMAEDELSDLSIAVQMNVAPRTLYNYKRTPEFVTYVKRLQAAWEAKVMITGIANKARRMRYLQCLHERQNQIVEARSDTPVPGGESGLIVVERRTVGTGEKAITEETVVFDHALSRELRATLAQAAEETGQTVSKHEISGPNGGPLQITIGVLDDIAERVRQAKMRRNASVTVTPQIEASFEEILQV